MRRISGAIGGAGLVCTALVLVAVLGGPERGAVRASIPAGARNSDSGTRPRASGAAIAPLRAGSILHATAGSARRARVRLLSRPPALPPGVERASAEEEHATPRIPAARAAIRRRAPEAAPTRARPYRAAALLRATDLHGAVDRGHGEASLTNEPSVASNGSTVFETWNWGAGVSTDGGGSFSYFDPAAFAAKDNLWGGFCCDQLAYYLPGPDLYVWIFQYIEDSAGSNSIRVAVARGAAGLAAGQFSYWNLTPQQLSGVAPGVSYDNPKVAATSSYLYLEVSAYRGSPFLNSMVLRLPISLLASGGPLSYAVAVADRFSPGVTQGAGSTMYFASHLTNASLRVYAWPDASPAPVQFDVAHSADPPGGDLTCTHVGRAINSDWCNRGDPRINGGWVGGGVIGFAWAAPQGTGALGTFPYPYVHVVRIGESSHALVDEPILWSPDYAFAYPSIVPNAAGTLGGVVMFGGGSLYENCGVITQKSSSPTSFWNLETAVAGNVDTALPKGGDYTTARVDAANPAVWSGGCYAPINDGLHSHPFYISFEGGQGGPPPPSSGRDTVRPAVRAYPSRGRRGKLMKLIFSVNDDSGQARESLTVTRGTRVVGRIKVGFDDVDGSVYFQRWRAPRRKGALRFCLRALDRAGNRSPLSCAGVRIK